MSEQFDFCNKSEAEVQQYLAANADFTAIAPSMLVSGSTLLAFSRQDIIDSVAPEYKVKAIALYNHLHPKQPEVKQGMWNSEIESIVKRTLFQKKEITKETIRNTLLLADNWEEFLHFRKELSDAIDKFCCYKFRHEKRLSLMISGLRRSGKTTLLKLFCIDSFEIIKQKNIFVFPFDCTSFESGHFWTSIFEPWIDKFFLSLSNQVEISTKDCKGEVKDILQKYFSGLTEGTIQEAYRILFSFINNMAEWFGFENVLFLIDEYEKTFPLVIDNSGKHFKTSLNLVMKNIIDNDDRPFHVVLSGTDAIQMGFASGNGSGTGTGVYGGSPILTRSMKDNVFSTTGIIHFDHFQKLCGDIEFPIIDCEPTSFDDYGGIAAYLRRFDPSSNLSSNNSVLQHLRGDILEQVEQDFANLRNILQFKPNLMGTSIENENEILGKFKTDLLCTLRGFPPDYIEKNSIAPYLGLVNLNVKVYSIILTRYLEGCKHKLTTPVILQLETNPSILGWAVQDACREYISTRNNTVISISYVKVKEKQFTELVKESLIFTDVKAIDLSQLANSSSLHQKVLYFDYGVPSEDRVKQWHHPGIDAICGGSVENSNLIIDAFQIKSTIHLLELSIIHTVVKFIVIRSNLGNESVLTKFMKSCYPHTHNVEVFLVLSDNTESNKIMKVNNQSTEQLMDCLRTYCLEKISVSFSSKYDTKRFYTGTVNIYMLIFGNINLDLVEKYPAIRFVWGPTSLESFIGPLMIQKLLCNPRFKLISIFQGNDLHNTLADLDTKFSRVLINNQYFYCLKVTSVEIIQQYLALKNSLPSRTLIEIKKISENKYEVKLDNPPPKVKAHSNSQKRSLNEVQPSPTNKPSKRPRTIVWERVENSIKQSLRAED